VHANARLTLQGRLTLIGRIGGGRAVAHVAEEMGVSRATAHKWWRRFQQEGIDGLHDRPSRAHCCPHRTRGRWRMRLRGFAARRSSGR
jgi:transposase-like protein